jgi:hypothetical protein
LPWRPRALSSTTICTATWSSSAPISPAICRHREDRFGRRCAVLHCGGPGRGQLHLVPPPPIRTRSRASPT